MGMKDRQDDLLIDIPEDGIYKKARQHPESKDFRTPHHLPAAMEHSGIDKEAVPRLYDALKPGGRILQKIIFQLSF
ncbi:MAG TPA: hypothetical protein H9744_15065 [Candidatus Eisenbergiella stercoravium]|nr:hypothetical protein [Candidatus Eisenbergiella stercoravium]